MALIIPACNDDPLCLSGGKWHVLRHVLAARDALDNGDAEIAAVNIDAAITKLSDLLVPAVEHELTDEDLDPSRAECS